MVISYVQNIRMYLPYLGATKHLTYWAMYKNKNQDAIFPCKRVEGK
jgi:hypothetical protein